MNTSAQRSEQFFTELHQVFQPQERLSAYNLKDQWRIIPYETADFQGTILCSRGGNPEDISFDPQLTGWYKIYLSLPPSSRLSVKLSGDPCFLPFRSEDQGFWCDSLEESFWRCADMTGQSIILTQKTEALPIPSMLGAIRFVPMEQQELEALQRESARTDTKRIYATNDMHCRLYANQMDSYEDWLPAVLEYDNSDVQWLSLEEIRSFISRRLPTEDLNRFCFPREGDRNVQEAFSRFDFGKVLKDCVALGHQKGLLMSVSVRMGAWGMGFPYDQCYFDCDFIQDHPEWRTVDRNGDIISALSYAYPQVRKYMVDHLVNMARSGCDAVTLIAHRGIPYVLFEKPVADRFFALYGEYPYELPLDEPRLNRLHCQIMTEFFQEARQALDREFGKNKVKLHLRTMHSLWDSSMVGIDTEQLAREGLIDTVISYPVRCYEKLDGDIWQPDKDYRIDLTKYTDYVRRQKHPICHRGDFPFEGSYTDYRGEARGPATISEWVQQWMDLEHKYGVAVYLELMPRHLPADEVQHRALELYDNGAQRFALWDTYDRVPVKAQWNMMRWLGHRQALSSMRPQEISPVRHWKIFRLAGYDVSRYNPAWGG